MFIAKTKDHPLIAETMERTLRVFAETDGVQGIPERLQQAIGWAWLEIQELRKEIGKQPTLSDQFIDFCNAYEPEAFKTWDAPQLRIAGIIAAFYEMRGLHVVEVPRGVGTTTLAQAAYLWFVAKGEAFPLFVARSTGESYFPSVEVRGIRGPLMGLSRPGLRNGKPIRTRPTVVFCDNPCQDIDEKSPEMCSERCEDTMRLSRVGSVGQETGVIVFVCSEFKHFIEEMQKKAIGYTFHRLEG